MISLYDDWLLRRERLTSAGDDPFAGIHIRVLDYLLIRYVDDPIARQPALFPLSGDACFNSRAMLVNRRLESRTLSDAGTRAHRLLSHIADVNPQQSLGPPGSNIPVKRWSFSLISLQRPAYGNGLKTFFFETWMRGFLARCKEELQHSDVLPEAAISYLADVAFLPNDKTRPFWTQALNTLETCENDSLITIFWHHGMHTNQPQKMQDRVNAYLTKRRVRVANLFRPALANGNRNERMSAARVLGAFGSLDDISLFQDLLALPDLKEMSEERGVYLKAMSDLAGQTGCSASKP